MKFQFESSDLHRRWTNQLYKEHQDISWFYRIRLRPVIIQLSDMRSAWGKWDSFYRTITISTHLIENYSWDVVVEILKHEMAHQYVTEHFTHSQSTAHGDDFKTACKRLGVASWAMRAAGELPAQIPGLRERVISIEDQRLLDRVEKLLSLAQSANEHEAFLAMQKSREIFAKHNLEKIAQKKLDDSMDSTYLTRRKKKTDPVEAKILSILNDHFVVRVVHTSLFDAKSCEKYQAAEILGRRENILMAEYVYHFLRQQCDVLWQSFRTESAVHGSNRKSYQLGVLAGFDEKLAGAGAISKKIAQDFTEAGSSVSALLKIESSDLDEFIGTRYPRLSKRSWSGGRIDRGIFKEGQSEGRRLNLNRPLESRGKFGGYLK
jgi:hypothetical protein